MTHHHLLDDQMATLAVVGDLMVQTPGLVEGSATAAGFLAARRELDQSAVVVANLEVPLSDRGHPVPKTINLRAHPSVVDDVRAFGVHAVTLANNHLMDYGSEALLDTIAACERAGIVHCGAGSDLDTASAPAWLTVRKHRVALLSLSCTVPIESDAGPARPGIAPLRVRFAFEADVNLLAEQPGTMPWVHSWAEPSDRERLCQAIAACRAHGADAVVVGIHWGVPSYWLTPYQGLLAAYQRPLAHALIDAGADAVCGHHAHQLHPIEVYRGKPILYSLGNFAFESPGEFPCMEPESVIARLGFGNRPSCDLVPLMIDERGLPRRATGHEADMVLGKVRELSRPFGTVIHVHDEIAVVDLAAGQTKPLGVDTLVRTDKDDAHLAGTTPTTAAR
ncbi:MAG: CapA family protein [Chloroflexota bacterium]|nr:CapA family protein [Chloroflexota bacterium]